MKISVIVPVYNCARYLRECLDSILNQSFKDWECICVDDGSLDESGKICDEYGSIDCRFRVIHQQNTGADGARNHALGVADGDWITFVDADDLIAREWFASAARIAETDSPDMVRLDRISGLVVPDGFFSMDADFDAVKYNGASGSEWALRTLSEEGYIWRCFIRREVAQRIRFRPNILCKEDGLWLVELIPYLRSISQGSHKGYFYRLSHPDSLTKRCRRASQCVAYLDAWKDIWASQQEWARRQGIEPTLRERVTQAVNNDIIEWVQKCRSGDQSGSMEIWKAYKALEKMGAISKRSHVRLLFLLPFFLWKFTGQTWAMFLTKSLMSLGRSLLKPLRCVP